MESLESVKPQSGRTVRVGERPIAHLDDVDVALANPNRSAALRLDGLQGFHCTPPSVGTHDRPDAAHMTFPSS